MKTKAEILRGMLAALTELESGRAEEPAIRNYLIAELATLYDVLDEDVPKEYRERIEDFLT